MYGVGDRRPGFIRRCCFLTLWFAVFGVWCLVAVPVRPLLFGPRLHADSRYDYFC